mmetsp:Transcript_17578/g.33065  ORF Transcript_17578/g.33065 Transcript_17578/m.33065 type:complete len:196 (+) Transcript_17578:79-666(+)
MMSSVSSDEIRERSLVFLTRCLFEARKAPSHPLEAAWAEVVLGRCAQEMEAAAWAGADVTMRSYRQKLRFLATSLRRPENSHVLQKVLSGEVAGRELVLWPDEEFLGQAQRQQRQQHRAEAIAEVLLKEQAMEFFDQRLSCPRCRESGARYAVLRDSWALPRAGGNMGHMRRDTGKCILAECPACKERWQQDGVV